MEQSVSLSVLEEQEVFEPPFEVCPLEIALVFVQLAYEQELAFVAVFAVFCSLAD